MKTINRSLVAGLAIGMFAAAGVARADGPGNNPDLFRAHEVSLDLFGSGSIGQETIDNISRNRVSHDVRLGAGAGLNYFVTRNFGFGVDAYTEDTDHSFVDSTSVNLIGRLPIADSGFAPYIFGGATRQFDEVRQWGADVGGGFEFRFDTHVALFIDARYVIAEETSNYGVGRAGLRVAF